MTFIHYERPQAPDPVNPTDLATKNYADTGRRTYMARAYRAAAFTFSATPNTLVQPFIWDTVSQGAAYYNSSTGLYTCPVAGVYLAKVNISLGLTASGQTVTTYIYVNGAVNVINNAITSMATATVSSSLAVVNCQVNDTIAAGAATSLASGILRLSLSEEHFFVALLGAL